MTYPLEAVFQVMKPNRAKKENRNQQAKLEQLMRDGSGYIAEPKIDGCHYNCIEGRIFSTHIAAGSTMPVEKTEQLLHIAQVLKPFGKAIFDGEVNFPGMKSNDVTTITGCDPDKAIDRQRTGGWLKYTVFDLLRLPDGRWIYNQPWYYRRRCLEEVLANCESKDIEINPYYNCDKQRLLESILESGGEGIVLKNENGLYLPGKRPMWNWMKIKTEIEDDVVIMGFEKPTMLYSGTDYASWLYWQNDIPVSKYHYMGWIGAIIMGKYDSNGTLIKVGTCSGMDEQQRAAFSMNPDRYIGKVAVIHAMEITRDGAYRHPTFKYIHPDKNAYECTL